MSKELLVEYNQFKVSPQMITESLESNGGKLIVSGVLQRANAKNQNGRIYSKKILEREISKYIANEIAQRRALGELDHACDAVVNLKNVSHNILECWWVGDDLMGKIEVLNTPAGNILRELFKANITVGISSRGMGSVKTISENDDTVEVQDDFSLVTFDFVSNPSTQGAFMKPISSMNESVNSNNAYAHDNKISNIIRDIVCELSGVCCINK